MSEQMNRKNYCDKKAFLHNYLHKGNHHNDKIPSIHSQSRTVAQRRNINEIAPLYVFHIFF